MNYFNQVVYDQKEIIKTQEKLKLLSMVDVTCFFDKEFISCLIWDTLDVYYQKLERRDFLMKHTENTPRHMFSVSERAIDECSPTLSQFYYDKNVLKFFSHLAQEEIMALPWTGERYVINGLSRLNDTHGWHWDDYSYALVFIAQAPKLNHGGEVECIPNILWNRKNPNIEKILQENKKDIYHFDKGSFYLMKSDTTLHRVRPITEGETRVAIAISWCNEADLSKNLDHSTVYELYGV